MFDLVLKYLLEGLAVAVAAYFIPQKKTKINDVVYIAIAAAATFAVLDYFAPAVAKSSRFGAGFGAGANLVGFGGPGLETFEGNCTMVDGKCPEGCEMTNGECKPKGAAAPMAPPAPVKTP